MRRKWNLTLPKAGRTKHRKAAALQAVSDSRSHRSISASPSGQLLCACRSVVTMEGKAGRARGRRVDGRESCSVAVAVNSEGRGEYLGTELRNLVPGLEQMESSKAQATMPC